MQLPLPANPPKNIPWLNPHAGWFTPHCSCMFSCRICRIYKIHWIHWTHNFVVVVCSCFIQFCHMFFFTKSSEIPMSTPFTWTGWSFPQIWWRSTAASTPRRKATFGAGPWPCCVAQRCSGCSWMWSQWVAASAPWPAAILGQGVSLFKWLGTIDISRTTFDDGAWISNLLTT